MIDISMCWNFQIFKVYFVCQCNIAMLTYLLVLQSLLRTLPALIHQHLRTSSALQLIGIDSHCKCFQVNDLICQAIHTVSLITVCVVTFTSIVSMIWCRILLCHSVYKLFIRNKDLDWKPIHCYNIQVSLYTCYYFVAVCFDNLELCAMLIHWLP